MSANYKQTIKIPLLVATSYHNFDYLACKLKNEKLTSKRVLKCCPLSSLHSSGYSVMYPNICALNTDNQQMIINAMTLRIGMFLHTIFIVNSRRVWDNLNKRGNLRALKQEDGKQIYNCSITSTIFVLMRSFIISIIYSVFKINYLKKSQSIPW